jgi:hypothetical protein
MITRSAAGSIMLAMTPSRDTRRLLLVTDRRASTAATPAAAVRRYRLARRHGDRHLPVALPVRKTA